MKKTFYQYDNNLIYVSVNYIYPKQDRGFANLVYNWHSGWLEYYERQITSSQKVIFDFRIDRITNDFVLSQLNLTSVAVIIVILLGMAVLVLNLIDFKKKGIKNQKISFLTFMREKSKRKNKDTNLRMTEIDKSLKIIEDTLKESGKDKKL